MIELLSEGFMLGLATGTTCLATCGPVYAPYLMQYERNFLKSLFALLEISAGRFITYVVIGIIAGFIGSSIANIEREYFTSIAYILFSLFLLLTTFRTSRKDRCCQTGKWAGITDRPLLLGLLTGINFCPSFLLAATKAIDHSGPLAGVVLFSSFFVGTSLFLLPLSFFGYFGIKKQFRIIARICAILISAWFIWHGAILLKQHCTNVKLNSNIDPSLIVNLTDSSQTAYFIGQDSTKIQFMKRAMTRIKKRDVIYIPESDTLNLPDSGIFFIGQDMVFGKHIESLSIRKKGRFIAILPDQTSDVIDSVGAKKIVDFLSYYSFKIDKDSGTVYQIPETVLSEKE